MALTFGCLLFLTTHLWGANQPPVSTNDIAAAQGVLGLQFSDSKIQQMRPALEEQRKTLETLRSFPLSNSVPPVLEFNPVPPGTKIRVPRTHRLKLSPPEHKTLPGNPEEVAFWSVRDLAALIKARKITSEQLTRMYLDRLKRYGPRLECIITLTEDLALEQARQADAEIASGKYRGPLHGIPYAAKDLLAVKGVPTTWGAAPYTNQVFDLDATVIQRLKQAGAVLVAKTTLGELAMGDVWFGGKTRNPWKLSQGSSGSSAGSAAATAAGLVAFSIGSETHGSIVSPSDRCGVVGLRPTFGRVSRAGAMTLSWSMDKIGPICRTAEDCAIVLQAIAGPDGIDSTVADVPFSYSPVVDLRKLRIGYLKSDFDKEDEERKLNSSAALDKLRALGAELRAVELPDFPIGAMGIVLSTEAAAAFEDLTRENRDDWLKQQESGSWPNVFRAHRFVPAVEFLQAQRIRSLLVRETAKVFEDVDVIVTPPFAGRSLLVGNLTGYPCVTVPNGFRKDGTPTSICFMGGLFREGEALAVARRYQEAVRVGPAWRAPGGFVAGNGAAEN